MTDTIFGVGQAHRRITVLVVGQNPKTEQNITEPFVGTKSYDTLKVWLEEAAHKAGRDLVVHYTNASRHVGEKPPKMTFEDKIRLYTVVEVVKPMRIIAVGKYAEKALAKYLQFTTVHPIPHTSGLNRKLNDKEFVAGIIKGMTEYLK